LAGIPARDLPHLIASVPPPGRFLCWDRVATVAVSPQRFANPSRRALQGPISSASNLNTVRPRRYGPLRSSAHFPPYARLPAPVSAWAGFFFDRGGSVDAARPEPFVYDRRQFQLNRRLLSSFPVRRLSPSWRRTLPTEARPASPRDGPFSRASSMPLWRNAARQGPIGKRKADVTGARPFRRRCCVCPERPPAWPARAVRGGLAESSPSPLWGRDAHERRHDPFHSLSSYRT
jgi:hypothetical protein